VLADAHIPQTIDEVDFTILAATSVLSDLIEKCPPAEACRDAFNRMSKATVQMCMSTTGFGTSTQGLNSKAQRSQRVDSDMSLDYFGAPASSQFAISNSRNTRTPSSRNHRTSSSSSEQQQPVNRQKPQFDMGLNDLFPASSGVSRGQLPDLQTQQPYPSSRNNGTRTVKNEYSAADAFGIPQNQIHSPSDYAISPPQAQVPLPSDTSAIDPSLLPSPHPQQQQLQPYIQQDPNAMMYGNSFGDLDFPLQGMDFLGNVGVEGLHGAAMEGQAGLDLGFGLGWEGMDHDFSEGNQLDLFDGTFPSLYQAYLFPCTNPRNCRILLWRHWWILICEFKLSMRNVSIIN
jgi:hypothetical protein